MDKSSVGLYFFVTDTRVTDIHLTHIPDQILICPTFLNQDKSLLGETPGGCDRVPAGQCGVLLHSEKHAVLPIRFPQPAGARHRQGLRTVLGS